MSTGYDPTLLDSTGQAASTKYAGVPDPAGSSSSNAAWGHSEIGKAPTSQNTKGAPMAGWHAVDPYYYNGPSTNPFDMHSAEHQRRQATMETWSRPEKIATLNNFAGLLDRYGHSNSPGMLWSLAQSGLDVNTAALQSALKADEKVTQSDYAAALPAQAGSDGGFWDNIMPDNIWAVPQAITREGLAALTMPMEAVQGAWRGTGGALTDTSLPWADRIGQSVAQSVSLVVPPLAAIIDGSLYKDSEFVNPWEQTQFGQTLLYGASNDWSDAFTTAQGGLDFNKAEKALQDDPKWAGQRQALIDDPTQRDAILTQVAKDSGMYGSPGWFIDETSRVGEAQRQATFNAWAIPGQDDHMTAWTFGRGIVGQTMGTDWAGYGFTSGMIDAVASVALDPTIFGAKFGVVAKSLRGAGLLAEKAFPEGAKGAELAMTFGKQRALVKDTGSLVNKEVDTLINRYNAMTEFDGVPLFKQDKLTLEDWQGYDLNQHVATVRLLKESEAAKDALAAASPSAGTVWQSVRNIRRFASSWGRAATQYEKAWEDVPAMARTSQLWADAEKATRIGTASATAPTEALAWVKADGVHSAGAWTVTNVKKGRWSLSKDGVVVNDSVPSLTKAKEIAGEAHGNPQGAVYDVEAEKAWYAGLSPEDQALWNTSYSYIENLVKSDRLPLKNPGGERSEELFQKAIAHYDAKVKAGMSTVKPTLKHADNVEGDAARLVLDGTSQKIGDSLKTVDAAGTTVGGEFIPGQPHMSVTDGIPTITYWTGGKANVVAADQYMAEHPDLSTKLIAYFDEVMKHPDYTFEKAGLTPADADTLIQTVVDALHGVENPYPGIREAMGDAGMSFGQMYLKLLYHGLEQHFADFLHGQGIDGIGGVNKATRDGVWFGDHPLLENYLIPSTTEMNVSTAAGMVDGADDFLNSLKGLAQPAGIRNMTKTEIEQYMLLTEAKRQKALEIRAKGHSATIDRARAEHVKLGETTTALDEVFQDPEQALKTLLQHEAGMLTSAGRGATVSQQGARWWLMGSGPMARFRQRTMNVLSNFVDKADRAKFKGLVPDSPEWLAVYDEVAVKYLGQLIHITKAKWSPDALNAVIRNSIDNGGEEGLLKVLAPRLGVDVEGAIPMSLKASEGDGLKSLETIRSQNSVAKRTVQRMMGERPGQREITLDSHRDVIDSVIKYGMYAKIDPRVIQKLTGRVALHAGRMDAVPTNVDVLKDLFNEIGNTLSSRLAESTVLFRGAPGSPGAARLAELQAAMNESTRLFLGGHVTKTDSAGRIAAGAEVERFVGGGQSVTIPKQMLESELIHGKLSLPNVDEWAAGMNRLMATIHRFPKTERLYDVARSIYDNFFRTSLLVFRGAYVIRNSAEMQIRMFLNGHHSVFSDPATLVGLVMGGGSKSELADLFATYSKTVLDTSFNVGMDEAAAFSNHVEKFYALTRQANSLTDPRVYRSTIYRGWQTLGVKDPQFSAGWANELLLHNQSALSRVVLGELPGEWKQSGAPLVDEVTNWLLSDVPTAARVRTGLVASNPDYATIFGSREMTKDYLFENENSVFQRVKQFTMGDPALEEFVKTGKYAGEGAGEGGLVISRMPRLEDRVNSLRSVLKSRFFDGADRQAAMENHMLGKSGNGVQVTVPWIDSKKLKGGSGFMDSFFKFANKIERLGTVGPEFQMAYWDKIAELAPGLNKADVGKALAAARTTLSPLQKMRGGVLERVGEHHPAWKALDKAAKENSDGFLKLHEIHAVAMDYAAEEVKGLFYDAARRNNFWAATRLLFPFGQAWGNTIAEWGKLGAKNPVQVYKVLKVLQGASEKGSSTIYDTFAGSPLAPFGTYAEGAAPWEQDPNGGFFYSNQYGDTSFMTPFVGRAMGASVNALQWMGGHGGAGMQAMDAESGTQSLNLALGSDSMLPGTSFLVPAALDLLPDSDVLSQVKAAVNPYGTKNVLESAQPAWAQATIGGLSAIPIVGDVASNFLSALSPSTKNKNVRDAVAILSASGDYDMKNPESMHRLEQDAANLGSSMLIITGIFKNWMPTSPNPKPGLNLNDDGFQGQKESAGAYAIGMLSKMYPQYLAENGGDEAAAKEQMLRDYGPSAIFGLTRNKAGYEMVPSSQARVWAQKHPRNMQIAETYPDYFGLFFPKGDYTDVVTKLWMEDLVNSDRQNLSSQEIIDQNVQWMLRTQKARVDFFEGNKLMSPAEADQMRSDIKETYTDTNAGAQFNSQTATQRIDQIASMYHDVPSLQAEQAGVAFGKALDYRSQAMAEAEKRTGTTLAAQASAPIKEAYLADLDTLLAEYPDFTLLHNTLAKEFG